MASASLPLISIVINNYNYADFIGDAIRSALAQDYPEVEVIVVDDGSKDHSREVIRGLGDRIIPVFKENGGQASAHNAGFRVCSGSVIIFLDSDDVLYPTTASRVAKCFMRNPTLAKVQYRLTVVDAGLNPRGDTKPPADQRMLNGDVLSHIIRFGKPPAPPTSGNAFAMAALNQIMPIPERAGDMPLDPDLYLKLAIALCGPVLSIEGTPGGMYRVHGRNDSLPESQRAPDPASTYRRRIIWRLEAHRHVHRLASELGIENFPKDATDVLDANFAYTRLRSLRRDPAHHPLKRDRIWRLIGHIALAGILDPQRGSLAKLSWIIEEGRKVLKRKHGGLRRSAVQFTRRAV